MHSKMPSHEAKLLSPFCADGSFDFHHAVALIADLKSAGEFELAETLELLNEFFRTSESYIFDLVAPLAFEQASIGSGDPGSQSASA